MQKRNLPRHIRPQPTNLPKLAYLPCPPPHPLREPSHRTTPARPTLAARDGHNAIVDIDAHKSLVARRFAVDVVRIEGVVPAFLGSFAGQALEYHAAAHGSDVGGAPGAVVRDVGGGEIGGLGEEVESGEHGDDVAVVHAVGV